MIVDALVDNMFAYRERPQAGIQILAAHAHQRLLAQPDAYGVDPVDPSRSRGGIAAGQILHDIRDIAEGARRKTPGRHARLLHTVGVKPLAQFIQGAPAIHRWPAFHTFADGGAKIGMAFEKVQRIGEQLGSGRVATLGT